MGLYLQLGDDKANASDLASTSGWGDVGRWADALPAKTADTLVHLWHHGYEVDLTDLVKEVKAAMKSHTPKPDVASTLTNLLSILKEARDVSYVLVTNGMTD